jgi:hypothetical protein
MKVVKMLLVVAMVVSASYAAIGDEGHDHGAAGGKLSKRDQLRVAVQGICPTSGQKLGAHGSPIKVKVGEETVFICCKGCLKDKINPQHWATIHANMAKAQGICLVMKKQLPANPKSTIVGGQTFFTCCPPCAKKIAADPKGHLAKLDELYAASLKAPAGR